MKRLLMLLVVAAVVVGAGRESAAEIITFNFAGGGGNLGSSHDFTASGTSVTSPTITATAVVPGIGGDFVQQTGAGLGVGHALDGLVGPNQIDNTGFQEYLNLELTNPGQYKDITIKSITFGSIENITTFSGILAFLNELAGDDDVQILFPNGIAFDPGSDATFVFAPGTSFNGILGITTPNGLGLDDFTVVELELDAVPTPEPMSLAGWLLVSATGAIVARRKLRKQRQAA